MNWRTGVSVLLFWGLNVCSVSGVTSNAMTVTANAATANETISPMLSLDIMEIPAPDLTFSGTKTYEFTFETASGAPENPVQEGFRRHETLELNVTGRAMETTVNIEVRQSTLGAEQNNRTYVELDHAHFNVIMGEFQSDFVSAALLNFREQIDGLSATFRWGSHEVRTILSTPKGITRRDIFFGNDSQGPFIVKSAPVVPHSEEVRLNGAVLYRQTDYTIDYAGGRIVFTSRILDSNDELVITYESESDQGRSRVNGWAYGFSGIPSGNSTVYYLRKSIPPEPEPSANAAEEVQIWVIRHRQQLDHMFVDAEVGLTEAGSPSSQAAGGPGGAGAAIKTELNWPSFNVRADYLKLNDRFISLDAVRSGGEEMADVSAQLDWHPHKIGLRHYRHSNRIGDTPVNDRQEWLNLATSIYDWPLSLAWNSRLYEEAHKETTVSTATATQHFHRQVASIETRRNVFDGAWYGRLNLENKQHFRQADQSYDAAELESGYTLADSDRFQCTIEGSLREESRTSGEDVSKSRYRLNSRYAFSPENHFNAIIEHRNGSGEFPMTLANMDASLSPLTHVVLDSRLSLESLKQDFNGAIADTEKWETGSAITWTPMPGARLRLRHKTKGDILRGLNLAAFDKQETSYEAELPMGRLGTLAIIRKDHHQLRRDLTRFPDEVTDSNRRDQITTISRARFRPWGPFQARIQYEHDALNEWMPPGTGGPSVSPDGFSRIHHEKLSSELSAQWAQLTAGVECELERENEQHPSANFHYKNGVSAWARSPVFRNSTIQLKAGLARNDKNGALFSSFEPEIEWSTRFSDVATFQFTYALETAIGQTLHHFNERWDSRLKLDLNRHILVSLSYKQENNRLPDYTTYHLSGEVSVVL